MEKFLRIGQVCKLYGLSLDTLRHYDRIGLLKPILTEPNGYRYYSYEQLDTLEMILMWRALNIPLEKIQEKLKSENINEYISLMSEQKESIERQKRLLEKLEVYADQMLSMLSKISRQQNDYSFETVSYEHMDIEIFRLKIEQLKHAKDIIDEKTRLQHWVIYRSDEDAKIKDKSKSEIGYSFLDGAGAAFSDCEKFYVTGMFGRIAFWGKHNDLADYLGKLAEHFNLKSAAIMVQYEFSLAHGNFDNEYFAEIYFPGDNF